MGYEESSTSRDSARNEISELGGLYHLILLLKRVCTVQSSLGHRPVLLIRPKNAKIDPFQQGSNQYAQTRQMISSKRELQ